IFAAVKRAATNIDLLLKERGLRITQARRGVFAALANAAGPLSAAQIRELALVSGGRFDLVTAYRTLETLERCGLVVPVERGDDGWRYALTDRAHHHSIVCSACGSAAPLEHCALESLQKSLEQATGYSNIRHSL